jgi:hypothetical protein
VIKLIIVKYHHRHIFDLVFLPLNLFLHVLHTIDYTTLIFINFYFYYISLRSCSLCKLSISSMFYSFFFDTKAHSFGETIYFKKVIPLCIWSPDQTNSQLLLFFHRIYEVAFPFWHFLLVAFEITKPEADRSLFNFHRFGLLSSQEP